MQERPRERYQPSAASQWTRGSSSRLGGSTSNRLGGGNWRGGDSGSRRGGSSLRGGSRVGGRRRKVQSEDYEVGWEESRLDLAETEGDGEEYSLATFVNQLLVGLSTNYGCKRT